MEAEEAMFGGRILIGVLINCLVYRLKTRASIFTQNMFLCWLSCPPSAHCSQYWVSATIR